MTRTTPELAASSLSFLATPAGGCVTITCDLACNRFTYAAALQRNRVSNLKPSFPEAETLPLGQRAAIVYKDICFHESHFKLIHFL
ncbi:hypothetical protein AVEN_29882-1 [Araneus ventricosus]|uniref:Uncharacterized protein n=1 Tax=Araneus ventricosus TaxID=182803 RepID=A0A4Y2UDS5_ARAVE|nr:hypothetical protein AVEN_29882-1 [Araneus ventricosus]